MRNQVSRLSALFMVLLLLPVPDWATCGGGGGGGMGGMRSGGSGGGPGGIANEQVYQVPGKLVKPDDALTAGGPGCCWVFLVLGRVFVPRPLHFSGLPLRFCPCRQLGGAPVHP